MAAHPQLPAPSPGVPASPPSVSAELEAIFLDATGLPSGRGARLPTSRKVRSFLPGGPRKSRIPVATFGAAAAAALIGLSAGAVMLSRPTVAPAAAVPAVAQAQPLTEPPAVPAAPVITLAGADESATDLSAPKTQRADAPAALKLAARNAGPHVRKGGHVTHADLLTADRRLRRAYARAVSAGVPRHILADYRDRWNGLRHDASWRPERVANGYDAMAGDLTRMSQRPHHHRRAPPPSRGWSLWRSLW